MADRPTANTVVINPVTRIEGHAKITLRLGEDGVVSDAYFHVNEFRGFEKFCEGRLYSEMPTITPRICGICPVSHAVASAKACEAIMRVEIPPAAHLLRRLLHLGQIISSHALSFFHLSSPDLLLGWDAPPADRNILGVAARFPDVARRGIRLRKFGQEISERITGKKVHTIGIVAGGLVAPLKSAERDALRAWIPEVTETAQRAIDLFKNYRAEHSAEVDDYASFPSLFLGLVGPAGEWEVYDGRMRFIDDQGQRLADQIDPARYVDYIAEAPVEWSYLKYPFYKPMGRTGGAYRVGPLARLNVAERMPTPRAQEEFRIFREIGSGRPLIGSFYFHYARLIETLAAIELVDRILDDPAVLSTEIFAGASRNQARGIGCTEAPRGILFHDYTTDDDGVLTRVNLLIATGQNNPAMNQAILSVARQFVRGDNLTEGALNRVEGAIRCFDPCLSCSTHAIGTMPLVVEIEDAQGRLLRRIRRTG